MNLEKMPSLRPAALNWQHTIPYTVSCCCFTEFIWELIEFQMLERPLQVNYSLVQIPVLTNKNGLSKSSLDFPPAQIQASCYLLLGYSPTLLTFLSVRDLSVWNQDL